MHIDPHAVTATSVSCQADGYGWLRMRINRNRERSPGTGADPQRCPASRTHLGPLGHLPLGPAGRVLADLALVGPGDVGGLAQVAVHGAVEARRDHLPAAHDAELVPLPAGPGALAPAARLPPA